MFNLIKDEFEENSDDILETINKMLEKNNKNSEEKENKENKKED